MKEISSQKCTKNQYFVDDFEGRLKASECTCGAADFRPGFKLSIIFTKCPTPLGLILIAVSHIQDKLLTWVVYIPEVVSPPTPK